LGWDGRLTAVEWAGGPVKHVYNQALMDWSNLVVPKGAPHPDAAMKLLASVTSPQAQAGIANDFAFGPINQKAFALVKPGLILPGSDQAAALGSIPINLKWWSENYDAINAKFTSWLNG